MSTEGLPSPFRLIAYDTIGSTNDEAKRLARDGEPEGMVICAGEQTLGRGRRGRAWASPPGNLYASILLRPECSVGAVAQLGFVAALSLAAAIDDLAPKIIIRCKWPNDLLANEKKVAGILLETEMTAADHADFTVVGTGVNLASSPPDTPYPATSLAAEGAEGIAPTVLVGTYIRHFADYLSLWRAQGFAPIRDAWLARAAGLGEPIQVRLERSTLDGRFLDLDNDGALLLDLPTGCRRITAGEIFPAQAA
ncbi:MAG TPA: biotin--[acetyl-CoA-carboxylase] ligase [Stellaceae bacterium]|nr:biotin--[acetyl-CoA-carboxylase] ligase [Stellaceae bacterium]